MGFLDSTGLTRLWNKIKSRFVSDISYDSTTRKLKQTVNGVTTDVATLNTMKIVVATQNSELSYNVLTNADYNAILEALPNVILQVNRYEDTPVYLTYRETDSGTAPGDYIYFTGVYPTTNGGVMSEGRIAKNEFPNAGEHVILVNSKELPSTAVLSSALSRKQDSLTFDDIPTANSNNPVKSNGIYNAVQNAIEIAEGKTKNYVISDATVSGYDNALFTATTDSLEIVIGNVNYGKIKDISGNDINFSDLKIGDIVSITETDVPDRWLASKTFHDGPTPEYHYIFYKLETKLDITNAVTQNETRPVTSGAVYDYIHSYNIIDLSVNTTPVPNSGRANVSDLEYNQINERTILKCTVTDYVTGNIVTNYYTLFRKTDTAYTFICLIKRTSQTVNGCSICTLPTVNIKHALSSSMHLATYDYYTWQFVQNITALPSSKMSAEVQASLAKADSSVQSTDFITDAEIDAVCV